MLARHCIASQLATYSSVLSVLRLWCTKSAEAHANRHVMRRPQPIVSLDASLQDVNVPLDKFCIWANASTRRNAIQVRTQIIPNLEVSRQIVAINRSLSSCSD
jgi:hypothetical protein